MIIVSLSTTFLLFFLSEMKQSIKQINIVPNTSFFNKINWRVQPPYYVSCLYGWVLRMGEGGNIIMGWDCVRGVDFCYV